MNRKPSRTFVSLALVMVFLLMIGLVVVGVLASNNRIPSQFEQTRIILLAINETTMFHVIQTETAKAAFTPIYYDASMSPTALPYTELHSMTAVAQYTPTPPYDAELFEKRRREELGLITGGGPTEYARFYMTETALVKAYQTAQNFTATPTATLTLTPSPTAQATNTLVGTSFVQCAYSWAHRDLPDVAILAQAALANANITDTAIRADAYGEECIASNTVVSFGAMTTDFYLTVEVSNLNGQNTLADYVAAVYAALSDLPQNSLPARLGYLDFTFTSGTTTKYLRTTFDDIKAAMDKNLSGQKFLDALGGLR